MRLRMETLRRKMMGFGGLKKFVENKFPERARPKPEPGHERLSGRNVTRTLSFMGKLSRHMPDKDIREALHERIALLVGRLQETDDDDKNGVENHE